MKPVKILAWVNTVLLAGLFVFLLVGAVGGSILIHKDGEKCKAAGGVQVKAYNGFACVTPVTPKK